VGLSSLQSTSRPGRYEYLRQLDQSGSNRSYLALDRKVAADGPGTARIVCVHLAPPSVARDEQLRSQFAVRAAALLPLRHPNVVRAHEYVADDHCCYWVSEAVQGLPLSRLLGAVRHGQLGLPIRHLIRIACDVLRGLEYAHAMTDVAGRPRSAVHRHVSPRSILVGYDGTVKIDHVLSCGSPELTTGPVAGLAERLPYLAPECCSGEGVDARADLYAVGAMVWEAVANRPRSFGATLQDSIEMRLNGSEPGLEQVCADAPPPLVALTRRALAKDLAERYQSARQLRQELEALMLSDALVSHADGSPRAAGESLVELMCNHFSAEYAEWVEIHRRHLVSISAVQKRVEGPRRASEAAEGMGEPANAPRPPLPSTGKSAMLRWRSLVFWILSSALLGVLAVFGLTSWLEPEAERPPAQVVENSLDGHSRDTSASLVAPPTRMDANGNAARTDQRELSRATSNARDNIAPENAAAPPPAREAERAPGGGPPSPLPRARSWRAREQGSPVAQARIDVARRATRLESDDAETLSALGKGADDPGLDLRTRKLRPPREIDKESPYSP
jgi:serine/threonine protein kinase